MPSERPVSLSAGDFVLSERSLLEAASRLRELAAVDPSLALSHAFKQSSVHMREAFFSAAWSQSDPGQLARFAMDLPVSDERTIALEQGVRVWVEAAPGAASEWLAQQPLTPDLDKGFWLLRRILISLSATRERPSLGPKACRIPL
ncbi:hypothetical protein IEN85_02165 [Pelagicoccus sp. NFK12]|uniref:Uncharacterized protein n=1 Tax=Pelagicoccus enzymogenes TaxID=2773457 RepID=A0A927F517_9BACT|nr:hypothetical protein [Pelagicoccus enzymogenes]MBD5778297.1 hypothetical protein [Pelagicoccus enzymogenes]